MTEPIPTEPIPIAIRRDPDARDLPLPAYASAGAAGLDLCAALAAPLVLAPGERALVSTGIALALPDGYEAQTRPRSGLALRHGLGLLNAPGTIDSDYRGTISVILVNWGLEPVTIRRGDRIAQLVVAPVARAAWVETDTLPPTARGADSFGSTGIGTEENSGEDREEDRNGESHGRLRGKRTGEHRDTRRTAA